MMKQKNLISRLRMAVLSMLMLCLSAPAWAAVTGSYDAATKSLTFKGSGEITQSLVRSISNWDKAEVLNITTDITGIGSYAFLESGLKHVSIPANVTKIEDHAFFACDKLEELVFANGMSKLTINKFAFTKTASATVKFTFKCQRMIEYNGVTSGTEMGAMGLFFNNPYIKSAVFEQSADNIPDATFNGCTGLTSVTMSNANKLTHIGSSAFYRCTSLTSIQLPQNVEVIEKLTFASSGIKSITFNDKISTIGDQAFYNSKLETLTIPSTVTSIGNYAFSETKLKMLSIPKNVTSIGERAFSVCDDLLSVTLEGGTTVPVNIKNNAFTKSSGATVLFRFEVKRPFTFSGRSNSEEIGSRGLFYKDPHLLSFIVGAGATVIPDYTCSECPVLDYLSTQYATTLESIGERAFQNCQKLFSVTLPTTNVLNSIGDYAFSGCSKLNQFENLLVVQTIGKYAFSHTALEEIILGLNLQSISEGLFSESKLKTISIPRTVTSIGRSAFENTKLSGISIPNNVMSIGETAFLGCDNLQTITFEDSSTPLSISMFAFAKSNDATQTFTFNFFRPFTYSSANIDLASMGKSGLFHNNKLLKTVVIGESVKNIPEYTFNDCTGLTSLTLSDSKKIVTIGTAAFYNCTNLTSSIPDLVNLESIGNAAFGNAGISSIGLGNKLTTISERAFQGSKLTSVSIPSSATSIGTSAFENTNLKSISIPSNVTSIGMTAFNQCDNLESITFENGTTTLNISSYAFTKSNSATKPVSFYCYRPFKYSSSSANWGMGQSGLFHNNTFLQSATIGANVSSVPEKTFMGCTGLTAVNLTSATSLTTIEQWAFNNTGIKTVAFPHTITNIKSYAFYNSNQLTQAYLMSTPTIGTNAFPSGTSLLYPDSGTFVDWYNSFPDKNAITELFVPNDNIANAGVYGQRGGLHEIFPNVTKVYFGADVTTIGEHIFHGASKLESVRFEGVAPIIKNSAFSGCINLSSLNGAKIKSVGYASFSGCAKLPSIEIMDDDNINIEAFYGCASLEVVILPNNLTTISDNAFAGCTSLSSLTLPEPLSSVSLTAFKDCNNLTDVTILGDAFANATWTVKDNIHDRLPYITDLTFGSKVTGVNNYAFITYEDEANPLKHLTFRGTTAIAQSSFYNSKQLESVTGSVKSVSRGSFGLCEKLKAITITGGESIGAEAFTGCKALASVSLPSTLSTIGEYAFNGCAALKQITFPASLTTVYSNAFADCSNLTNLTILGEAVFNSTSNKSLGNIYKNITNLTLGKGVANIAFLPLNNAINLEKLTLSENLTSIQRDAFRNSLNLTDVTILSQNFVNSSSWTESDNIATRFPYAKTITLGSSCSVVGANAFAGSKALEDIVQQKMGFSGGGLIAIGANAFKNCTALRTAPLSVTSFIEESLQTETLIGESAFSGCTSLTSLDLTAKYLKSLPANVFAGCSGLQSLVLPECFESMVETTFLGCYNLTDVTINGNAFANNKWDLNYNISYLLPYTTDLTFGPKVTEIGDNAFKADADVPSSLQHITFMNVPTIGRNAFGCNKNLVSIEGSVKSVSGGSFQECESLQSITIVEDDVIEKSAFFECKALATVNLPEGLTEIVGQSFCKCYALKNIVLPSTVTSIGYQAFYESGLESIELPSGISVFGDNAFAACKSLSSVTCHRVEPVDISGENVFENIAKNACLYVPAAGLEDYKNAEGWKEFFSLIDAYDVVVLVDGQPYISDEDRTDVPLIRYTRTFNDQVVGVKGDPEKKGKWQALCVPFGIDVAKYAGDYDIAEIYTFSPYKDTNKDGEVNSADEHFMIVEILKTGTTTPGLPYVIRPRKANCVIESSGLLAKSETPSITFGTSKKSYEIIGILEESVMATVANQYYYVGADGSLSHRESGSTNIRPNRWYMTIEDHGYGQTSGESSIHSASMRIVAIGEDLDETTAIRAINGDYSASGGNIEYIYTLDGRRVNNNEQLPQGIYIKNGKKVFIAR